MSPFGAAERTWKPFNPVLGETFELEGVNDGVSFFAEQARTPLLCLRDRVISPQRMVLLCCAINVQCSLKL